MEKIIEEYQRKLARILGAERAFAFWKGRVALYALLRALEVGAGDEVILPGYTCVMNVNPIKYAGAKPVYVDIEPDTFNMNVNLLKEKITNKTKVIIAQHTYGYPCEMDMIMKIAQSRGIPVIEDCCLALGSKYKGRMVGTFGRAGYFSSQWNKPYTTGLGGMVITSDRQLAERIAFGPGSLYAQDAIDNLQAVYLSRNNRPGPEPVPVSHEKRGGRRLLEHK